jgi:prepilin-type N-terminal cleavage/methylation domain-containing protein
MSAPPAKTSGHPGFTLLEVLITAVLLATLMVGVWSLYRMFASLYETGYVRIEQAQLIRSVTQQLADDLAGTVLPPLEDDLRGRVRDSQHDADAFAMSGADGVASSADRVGFLGTYDGMRLDVLQAEAPELSRAEPEDMQDFSLEEAQVERSAEIVTVIYSFQPPPVADEWSAAQPGLKRQEYRLNQSSKFGDWGVDGDTFTSSSGSIIESEIEQGEIGGSVEPSTARDPLGNQSQVRIATMVLPEIVAMEFRYYDGEEWTDTWDSRIRRTLPQAVEVAMQIEFERDMSTQISEAAEILPATDDAAGDEETFELEEPDLFADVDESRPPRLPIHRFVVHLPQAIAADDHEARDDFDEPAAVNPGLPPLPDVPFDNSNP